MKRLSLLMVVVGVALLLNGCAGGSSLARDYVNSNAAPKADLKVVVMPFENYTNHPGAGEIAAQLLTTELYQRGLFRLTEESTRRRALADLHQPDIAVVAQRLNVDAVLVGSVSEYGYRRGVHDRPTVGLNARLVRAGDGEVLWAASHSEVGKGFMGKDSLNEAAQRVVARMVENLQQGVSVSRK